MADSVKKALSNREKCRRFQERLKAGVLFCAMETTCLHCQGWGCWRSIADGAGQLHGGKGWAVGTTGQVHATEAKNHFAAWSQKWRQWSWTPCEAQTAGNFGMPPAKPNHLCCWPHKIGACLAFLAQLCLGFHLIFAKEHI